MTKRTKKPADGAADGAEARKRGLRSPWKPGQSGNPKGRKKGTRNKATLAAQALLDGEAESLTRKAVELALQGDTTALRLCLERLVPPCREAPVIFDVPAIKTAADAVKAMGALLEAVAEGRLTPTQGTALAGMIETFRRTLETEDLARRLALIEERERR